MILMMFMLQTQKVYSGDIFDFTEFHLNFRPDGYNVCVCADLEEPETFDSVNVEFLNPEGKDIFSNDPWSIDDETGAFCADSFVFPTKLPGDYTLVITKSNGSSESIAVNTEDNDFFTELPKIITPINGSTIIENTPSFTWEAFSPIEQVGNEIITYYGEVDSLDFDTFWSFDNVRGTFVEYNFNNQAVDGFEALPSGQYLFILSAYIERSKDNVAFFAPSSFTSADFTVAKLEDLIPVQSSEHHHLLDQFL